MNKSFDLARANHEVAVAELFEKATGVNAIQANVNIQNMPVLCPERALTPEERDRAKSAGFSYGWWRCPGGSCQGWA